MSSTNPLFFFNDTATTEIYTLSLHDALPILAGDPAVRRHLEATSRWRRRLSWETGAPGRADGDRKSTRLNSSHSQISYAVFCLKKKTINIRHTLYIYSTRSAYS